MKRAPLSPKGLFPIIFAVLLVYFGATHRYLLFKIFFDDLGEFVSQNPNILTYQYLSIPALTRHFWSSLLYLQQTPPIPNMLLGFVVTLFGWPTGTAYCLILIQAVLSLVSTLLFFRLLFFLNKRVYLNALLAVIFLFSTDTVVMEYNTFGQNIYEQLAMFLLLLIVYCFFKLLRAPRLRYTCFIGILTAMLALTRASYSYFFVIPLVFLLFTPRPHKARHVLVYVFFILLLQGGWCGKNYLVYDTFSLSTSSWKGVNFAAGLTKAGMGQEFLDSIFRQKDCYPAWFIEMLEKEGIVSWFPPKFLLYLPDEIKQQDARIQTQIGNTNRPENSIGLRVMSDLYMQAYTNFVFSHPDIIGKKFLLGYVKFWEPIRNFGIMYMGPLFIIPKVRNSFRADRVMKEYFMTGIEEQFFMTGNPYDKKGIPVNFYTLPYLPIVMLLLNVLTLHLLLPCLLLYSAIRLFALKESILSFEFFLLLACFCYAAVVMNLPEYGENMRFRVSIEPIIWLLSICTIQTWGTWVIKRSAPDKTLLTSRKRDTG